MAGARREVTSGGGGAGPVCVCVREGGAGGAAAQAAPRELPDPERPGPTRTRRHGLAAQGGPGGEAQGATRPAGSGRGAVAARPLVVRPPARFVCPPAAPTLHTRYRRSAGADGASPRPPRSLPEVRRILVGPSGRCSVPGSPRLPSPGWSGLERGRGGRAPPPALGGGAAPGAPRGSGWSRAPRLQGAQLGFAEPRIPAAALNCFFFPSAG